ncbi:hydrolase, partial [Klebsiella pneumoniae]|uniref:hydrolase n=1 Tax=Klebsiella pneumoniae TaxID=573 RepID=UPI001330017E
MKLNQIAKNLTLAGMLSSLSITAFAAALQQDATPATREANQALYRKLPCADKTDFNNAHQGF